MGSWKSRLAMLLIVAVIVHGSLYPYNFDLHHGGIGPIGTLIASWAAPPTSYGDLVANILLYTPLGFFGLLTIRGGPALRLFAVTIGGLLLSFCVEAAQYYDADRVCSMSDIYLNTSGAFFGGACALLFTRAWRFPQRIAIIPRAIPILLILAMLGYRLFPYVPTIDLHKYWHSVRPLLASSSLPTPEIFRYFLIWLIASYLLGAIVGYRKSRLVAPLFVGFVFAGRILIETLALSLPETAGAVLAIAVWLIAGSHRQAMALLITALLFSAIVALRLEPFHFQHTAHAFGWLPFRAFIGGSLRIDTIAFLEKFFYYGSLIWFLTELGLRLRFATVFVALLLLVTSLAEMYLPGRSAEVTDAVMALMIGFVMAPMRIRAR